MSRFLNRWQKRNRQALKVAIVDLLIFMTWKNKQVEAFPGHTWLSLNIFISLWSTHSSIYPYAGPSTHHISTHPSIHAYICPSTSWKGCPTWSNINTAFWSTVWMKGWAYPVAIHLIGHFSCSCKFMELWENACFDLKLLHKLY